MLAPHLDIDEALKFLALEVVFVNTDGYWTRASDYSIYQEESGRFHVLPYDFNEAMGVESRAGAADSGHGGPTLDPLVGADDVSKPLRARLLAVPALRERYLRYVHDIADTWLDWNSRRTARQGISGADRGRRQGRRPQAVRRRPRSTRPRSKRSSGSGATYLLQ